MFGLGTSKVLERLRDDFGSLEKRVAELETRSPAVAATLLDAQDKLHRASARWEKAMGKAARAEGGSADADDAELEELWSEVHRR